MVAFPKHVSELVRTVATTRKTREADSANVSVGAYPLNHKIRMGLTKSPIMIVPADAMAESHRYFLCTERSLLLLPNE